MKKTTIQTVNREFNRLKRKLKLPDLTFILQEDVTNEHIDPKFYLQISGFSARLAPISFMGNNEDEFVKDVKKRLRKLEFDEIEIAWLESMADEHKHMSEQYGEMAKNAKNRLLVEGSTNHIREPLNSEEEESK